MALVDGLSFAQNVDITSGVVTDISNYGVSGNPARNAKANYLLWSKTDSSGNRVFTNPDQGDVLATLLYTVSTLIDGFYEGILLRIAPYNNGTSYVEQQSSGNVITQYASIVYLGGVVYQCTSPTTGNTPPNGTYWAIVSDLSTLIDNPNVDVFIQDVYIKIRSMTCAAKQFKSCGCGGGHVDFDRPFYIIVGKLYGADSEFANGNPTEMQKIIEDITSVCSTCGS